MSSSGERPSSSDDASGTDPFADHGDPVPDSPDSTDESTDEPTVDRGVAREAKFGESWLARVGAAATVVPIAVVIALLRRSQPTGTPVVDQLWTAAFVALVVLSAQRASRTTVLWLSVVAFVFSDIRPWLAAPVVGLALMLLIPPADKAPRLAAFGHAVVAACAVQAVLRFPGLGFTGSSALLAALATVPVLVSGYRRLDSDSRPRVRKVVMALGAVGVVGTAVAALSVLWARGPVEDGIAAAEEGLDFARAAEQDEAIDRLILAEGRFGEGHKRLDAWWTKPARLVPIVAQHSRAVGTAAEQGAALTQAAAAAAGTADIDQVRVSGGRLDLDLLDAVGGELAQTLTTVNTAVTKVDDASVPWLVPPLADRIDTVRVDLGDAQSEIDLAAHATRVVPGMLGADGPRSYLVIFTTPAESRELGGFIGNWALMTADDGQISQGVADPSSYPERYVAYLIDRFFQNLTGTPDFPTVARAVAEIFPQMGGSPIDGLISVDPFAIAALLELAGPVEIAGLDEPLDSDNVVDFLLEDQYEAFDDLSAREDALGNVAERAFSALLSSDIPGPERLGAVLGPVARQDRLLMTTFVDEENEFLERVFLRGEFPAVDPSRDFLSVVHDAAVNRKLDTYLHRDIEYSTSFDPGTGAASHLLRITLRNDAPDTLDEYVAGEIGDLTFTDGSTLPVGHNYVRMSIYTPAELDEFRGFGTASAILTTTEYGYNRYLAFVDVPPGESVTIEYDLSQTLPASDRYQLTLASQPLVNTDDWTVVVTAANAPDVGVTEAFQLVEDVEYAVDFTS